MTSNVRVGFREVSRSATSVNFHIEGDVGVLEILKMDAGTRAKAHALAPARRVRICT